MLDRVTLSAVVRLMSDRVDLDLSLANDGDVTVYASDVAVINDESGIARVRRDVLSVGFEAPATAVLSARREPIPVSVRTAFPRYFHVSAVGPHQSHQVTLTSPLPLRLATWRERTGPSGEPPEHADRILECESLRFELGVIQARPDFAAREVTVEGVPLTILNGRAPAYQEVLAVTFAPLVLPFLVAP